MKKFVKIAVCSLLATAMLASCAPKQEAKPTESATTEAANTETAAATEASSGDKKRVVYAINQELETLDPTLNNYAASSTPILNMHRGLFRVGSDGKAAPALLDTYEVDPNFTKWTFKLKSGLKFSDGSPLTAKDFEYAIVRLADPATASKAAGDSHYIKGGKEFNEGTGTREDYKVKAIDDLTLEIETVGPAPFFPDILATTAFVPVKEAAVKDGWTSTPETYIASGPFKLKEILPGEKYVLEKNPEYYNAANVKIDEVEIMIIESQEAQLVAYENDEINVAVAPPAASLADYKSKPDFVDVPRIQTIYFDFNHNKDYLKDAKVRRALSIAIDRESIIKNVIQAEHLPANGFVPPLIPNVADPTKTFRETVGDQYKYDVAEAKKLLAEAGYPDGKGFPTLQFITQTTSPKPDIAQAMQAMWKEIGVNCEIKTFEPKTYWDEFSKEDWDLGYDGWSGDYLDPAAMFITLDWPKQEKESRWKNDKFVALLKENREIGDQAKREANFEEAEKILLEDMPVIPLYYTQDFIYVKPNIKGIYRNYLGHTYFEEGTVE